MVIVDFGYKSDEPNKAMMMAISSHVDSDELQNFKIRMQLHHEQFNAIINAFNYLSKTFKDGFDNQG